MCPHIAALPKPKPTPTSGTARFLPVYQSMCQGILPLVLAMK